MIDEIISKLREAFQKQVFLSPEQILQYAFDLSLGLEEEKIKLAKIEQSVAQKQKEIILGQDKKNVAAAENEIKSDPLWLDFRTQEARVGMIKDVIRNAESHAKRLY